MIPKIIHLIWVGSKQKPELVKRCIASWKKNLPDYEIMEWDNESLRDIDNRYVSEAFSCQKWAFVSDYLRLYALYHYGGIYLDSDVEVTQSLDPFLHHDFFSGYESLNNTLFPITAVMGATKHNQIIKDLLEEYNDIHFITIDQQQNLKTNTLRISEYFQKQFQLTPPYDKDITTPLDSNSIIYPSYFFCTPQTQKINYTIHHFNGSWVESFSRKNKFQFLNLFFVRFKRENNKNDQIPLLPYEKILLKIKVSKKRTYAITRKSKNIK